MNKIISILKEFEEIRSKKLENLGRISELLIGLGFSNREIKRIITRKIQGVLEIDEDIKIFKQLSETIAAHASNIVKFKLDVSEKIIKILFLAANPKNTTKLRLDEEIREIDRALMQAEFRERFDIHQHWAVRVSDLQSHLLRYKPDILHVSGHGSYSNELILEDNYGNSNPVSKNALSQLFSLLKGNIRCVVLNACYSEPQAKEIAKYVDCVIGMSAAISDEAAISFSVSFYRCLGYGMDVQTAFDSGCLEIDLENLGDENIPKILAFKNDPQEIVFV